MPSQRSLFEINNNSNSTITVNVNGRSRPKKERTEVLGPNRSVRFEERQEERIDDLVKRYGGNRNLVIRNCVDSGINLYHFRDLINEYPDEVELLLANIELFAPFVKLIKANNE